MARRPRRPKKNSLKSSYRKVRKHAWHVARPERIFEYARPKLEIRFDIDRRRVKQRERSRRYRDTRYAQALRRARHPLFRLDGRPDTLRKQRDPNRDMSYFGTPSHRIKDPGLLRKAVCTRRKVRRIMLFINRFAGKGGSGPKRRHLTVTSNIKC